VFAIGAVSAKDAGLAEAFLVRLVFLIFLGDFQDHFLDFRA
jgi:hypothetical protein